MITTCSASNTHAVTSRGIGWLVILLWISCTANLPAQDNQGSEDRDRDVDITAPTIEVEELTESPAGTSQLFTAQVVDDKALKDVVLYHRREGQSAYQRRLMSSTGFSGVFSVSIDTDPSDTRAIEYYFQARDENGNRTVSAFAFAPYRRILQPKPEPAKAPLRESNNTQDQQAEPSSSGNLPVYKQRWFQIGLGVLAVGLIASQLDEDDEKDRQVVPVTINLQ